MKKNKLLDKILHNWYLKLLCLIAAILIYIFYKSSLVETKSFIIPLNLIENGSVLCVEKPKSNIKVVVKADSDHIGLIRTSDIVANLDISNVTKTGTVNLPINITFPKEYYSYDPFEIRCEPEYIKVNLEKKVAGLVKLEPLIAGQPAHGYQINNIKIEPSYVEIVGSENMINSIEVLNTSAIDVTDAKDTISREVKAVEFNKQISVINKGPYIVTIDFIESLMERTIENVPVYITGLWPDLHVDTNLPALSVNLEGAVASLEKYVPPKKSLVIDLSEITEPGTYELPVIHYFPNSFKVNSISQENISVTISKIDSTLSLTNENTDKSKVSTNDEGVSEKENTNEILSSEKEDEN